MPIYVPTDKIVDERVLASFYRLMSERAEQQGFSSIAFPVVGDLSLSDVMSAIKDQTPSGMKFYKIAMNLANFGVARGEKFVGRDTVEAAVVDSYKNWLRDIATDRIAPKLHDAVLERVIVEHPVEGIYWQRADDLIRRRELLGLAEKEELRELENSLSPKDYTACREAVKAKLIGNELPKVEQKYIIPGTGRHFSYAFAEIESGSAKGMELYEKLVELHAKFKFRNAA
jgi:hypothetical protein